ncbi:MAG: M48 family metalloprotease [Candidatus Micrarchaeota archaeon]
MLEMWDHLVFGIDAFIGNQANVTFTILSLALALLVIYKLRDANLNFRPRLLLIYSHLALISFPALLLATSLSCISAGLGCPVTIARFGLLLFPLSIIFSMAIGSLLLPLFFMLGTRRSGRFDGFLRSEARKLGIRIPNLRIIDSQKPVAYSVSGLNCAVFLSIGMLETFSRKELEAVLLHELSHLQRRSPLLKISSSIMNVFSPIARTVPSYDLLTEEESADGFAARRQGTAKYLLNAKNKSQGFR